jgi:hypothetical protein
VTRNIESSDNIFLKELHHNFFYCFLCWDSFHPSGEVVSGVQNPFITITRVFLELTNEIQSPLLKVCFYEYWLKGKGGEMLFVDKELTRLTGSDVSMRVGENSGPIISCP